MGQGENSSSRDTPAPVYSVSLSLTTNGYSREVGTAWPRVWVCSRRDREKALLKGHTGMVWSVCGAPPDSQHDPLTGSWDGTARVEKLGGKVERDDKNPAQNTWSKWASPSPG